jgi:hypothetical protein
VPNLKQRPDWPKRFGIGAELPTRARFCLDVLFECHFEESLASNSCRAVKAADADKPNPPADCFAAEISPALAGRWR